MKNRGLLIQPAIIFIFSLILYGNTIIHQYALDDSIVITENQFTKKGLKGLINLN